MARISEVWRAGIQRALVVARDEWRNLPRPQLSVQRVLLMAAFFGLSVGVLQNCYGNIWIFCCGGVMAGQLLGAAAALPFRRALQGAVVGTVIGLLFFTFAIIA